jgi:hypothetical protein
LRNVFPFSKSPSFLSCMIEFRTSMGKIKLTNINGTRPSKRKFTHILRTFHVDFLFLP